MQPQEEKIKVIYSYQEQNIRVKDVKRCDKELSVDKIREVDGLPIQD